MKRILIGIATIAAVSAIGYAGTKAFFTDTETSNNNSFTTGTIDIAIDGQNPWNKSFALDDMKPSQVDYINFVVHNVGTNPVNVTKKIDIKEHVSSDNNPVSESECAAEGGKWADGCTGNTPVMDLEKHINYDMTVWVYDVDPSNPQNAQVQPKWWQVIYTDAMGKTLDSLNHQDMILGMVPANWYMKVQQSYHMPSGENDNLYQGDKVAFDITVTGTQLTGSLVMENKDFADQINPTIVHDDVQGTLLYGVKDSKFNYSFSGKAPLLNTNYSLIFYEEAFSTPAHTGWPRNVIVLGTTTSDATGLVSIPATSVELNQNISNMKVWLVKSSDLVGSTETVFTGPAYLFETGLIDYYDSDL